MKLRELVRLGDDEGPGAFAQAPWYVTVDSKDRYLVFAHRLPQVFLSNGTYLTDIGRPGRGPGEFAGAALPIVIGGDSVLIPDGSNNRAAIFDPSYKFVRQIKLPFVTNRMLAVRWPDSVVAIGLVQNRELFGLPIHLIRFSSSDATLVTSGGENLSDVRPSGHRGLILGTRDNNQLWTSSQSEYEITRWTKELKEQATFIRRPRWWPKENTGAGTPTTPPSPLIDAIHVDERGLVWVFIRIAGKNWQQAWPKGASGREVGYHEIRHEKLYSSIVEVIDPATGRLITRSTLNMFVIASLPGRRIAAYGVTSEGIPHLRVFHVSITDH